MESMRGNHMLVIMAVVGTLLFAATAQAAKTKISIVTWTPDEYMKPLIEAFQRVYPQIEIELLIRGSGDGYREQITVWALAGELPDIVNVDSQSGNLSELVMSGAFLELSSRVEREINREEMLPTSFLENIHVFNGRYYGMPSAANVAEVLFVVNRELFSRAGVGLPPLDWTWDQFVSTTKKLTHDADGDGTPERWGAILPHMMRYPVWIWSGGAELFDHNTRPQKTLIDSPAAIGAVQWLADLNLVHRTALCGNVPGVGNAITMFNNDQAGLGLFSYQWAINGYGTGVFKFDWGLAKIPAGPGGAISLNKDNPWLISANTKNADAAWAYLKWRLSPEAQQLAMQVNQANGPLLRSVIQRSNWLKSNRPPYDMSPAVFHDMRVVPAFPGSSEMDIALRKTIEQVWRGEKPARQALTELAPQFNAQLAELAKNNWVKK